MFKVIVLSYISPSLSFKQKLKNYSLTTAFLNRNVLPGHMDTYTEDIYMGSTLEELEHVVDAEDTCLK